MDVHPYPGFDDFLAAISGCYVYKCMSLVETSIRLLVPLLSAIVNQIICIIAIMDIMTIIVKECLSTVKIVKNNFRA
jgi:hypothetical protein